MSIIHSIIRGVILATGIIAAVLILSPTVFAQESIQVFDDTFSPIEIIRVEVIETKQIDDGIFSGTVTDLGDNLSQLNANIAALEAERDRISSLKGRVETELGKLPARQVRNVGSPISSGVGTPFEGETTNSPVEESSFPWITIIGLLIVLGVGGFFTRKFLRSSE